MASELRRGLVRTSANYGRQFLSLSLNVFLIAVLFAWLGEDGFGLIVLVNATVGVTGLIDDLVRGSLIRELAQSYHRGDPRHFRAVYNSAWTIAGAGAALCALAFAVAWFVVPLLGIEPHLLAAARWMLLAEACTLCAWLLFSPALNMYIVQERFVADNLWTLTRKFVQPLAAILVWKGMGVEDPARGASLYFIIYNAGNVALLLAAAGLMIASSRQYAPAPWLGTRSAMREILGTIGWNSLVNIVVNLHERLPAFVMYSFFGLSGSAVYGLAMQLASYVRMLTTGVNFGLEAVAARVSHHGEAGVGLAPLARTYTMLHALMALPGSVFIALMAEPLVRLWIGRHVDDGSVVAQAVLMTPILVIPVFARAMSECWIRIVYGAGYIRKLSRLVLAGGIAHPLLSLSLLFFLDDPILRFNAPALGFVLAFTLVHLFLIPLRTARILGGTRMDTIGPVARPAAIALLCAPILVAARLLLDPMNLLAVGAAGTAFGATYLTLAWRFVLSESERRRLLGGLRARLGFARPDPLSTERPAVIDPTDSLAEGTPHASR